MSSYVSEKHRDGLINSAKNYYHNSNGRFRKAIAYYIKVHPELNADELFEGIEDDWEKKYEKIMLYHSNYKANKVTQMFLNKQNKSVKTT